MPKLSQIAMKAAMLYLVAGALGAAAYWLNVLWPFWPPIAAINPTYLHLIVVGWLTQFIMSVMYWMFPVISKSHPRGYGPLAWGAFICLNIGLLLRVVFEPWRALQPLDINSYGLVASAILQVAAAVLFVLVSWRRVRERGGS